MTLVVGKYQDCGTAGVRGLDRQLIAQIQELAPDALVSFAHLPVSIGSGCHAYLQAPAVRALELAIASRAGTRLTINSAYRTIVQQTVLYSHYQKRRCGITAAAIPGKSNHNTGLSLDVEDAQGWKPYLERHGWDWIGAFDPMHFDYEGGGVRDLRSLSIKAFQQLWNHAHPEKLLKDDGVWGAATHNAILSTSITGFLKVPTWITAATANGNFPSLREGMSGESVRALQQALLRKGILIDVDGDFGASTLASVKQFQKKTGLDADGVVGLGTKKALGLS